MRKILNKFFLFMKRLSEYKGRILRFLWAFTFVALMMCVGWCLGWGDYPRVVAMVAGGLGLLRMLVAAVIPDPARVPGYYWVRINDYGEWVPGELRADGEWEYMGCPWACGEGEFLAIGARIER